MPRLSLRYNEPKLFPAMPGMSAIDTFGVSGFVTTVWTLKPVFEKVRPSGTCVNGLTPPMPSVDANAPEVPKRYDVVPAKVICALADAARATTNDAAITPVAKRP